MRFANSDFSVDKFGQFVNGLAVFLTVTVIAAGYVSAIGSFAGVA
ncbi:hypothetical protein [Hyphococcus sp.]|jgi:hypothetical protein